MTADDALRGAGRAVLAQGVPVVPPADDADADDDLARLLFDDDEQDYLRRLIDADIRKHAEAWSLAAAADEYARKGLHRLTEADADE